MGSGFSVTFATASNEGLVQGFSDGVHAVPVAGVTGMGAPTYLTGDFGSAQTVALAASGNYLSTGLGGTITIGFSQSETAFTALWGSIDAGTVVASSSVISFELTGAAASSSAISVPVPEPASLALLGAGLLGFAAIRRRKL